MIEYATAGSAFAVRPLSNGDFETTVPEASTIGIPPEIILSNRTYLNFLRPHEAAFNIHTIAAGLSKVCRWGAQCDDFYSVAQHSVLVSMVVPRHLALWGLLHDASEGLMGLDMTSPLKQLCPDFKTIEKRVQVAVFERFGIDAECDDKLLVKAADRAVEATERRDLMGVVYSPLHEELFKGAAPLRDLRIEPWDHRKAKHMFMVRYQKIMGLDHNPVTGAELARLHAMVR